jgi:glycine oxidase
MKVIVVGAGIMGLASAWRLAAGGATVHLFEARSAGGGATGASLGALWPASPLLHSPLQEFHRASLWQFSTFLDALSAEGDLPIPFRRLGRIEILPTEKARARAAEEAAFANEHWPRFRDPLPAMEVLSPDQLHRLQPGVVSRDAALLCRTTAQVRIPPLVAALTGACRRRGVVFHEATPVCLHFGDTPASIPPALPSAKPLGEKDADAFLLTAGIHTPQLAPDAPLHLSDRAPVRPVKGQGLALALPPDFRLDFILKSGPTYLVPWEAELLVGSTTEPDAGDDLTPTPAAREQLLAAAIALVPALRHARVLRHWAGLRPQNPRKSHTPFMGPVPGYPHIHLCTAHYKTGIGMAPLASSLVSQGILTGKVPAELLPFLPADRPTINDHQ